MRFFSDNSRTRVFQFRLGLLAVLGVICRLIVSGQLIEADSFVYAPPDISDMATYLKASGDILSGKIPDFFYYQPFYYAVFLPAARWVFRSPVWAPAIAQSLCAGLVIYLSGLCAAQIRSRRAGYFAGFFAAFASLLVLYVPYALLEIQQCLWFTLLFYLTLRAMRTDRIGFWCGTGVVLSIAILSRGNAWCFLPPLILAFVYARHGKRRTWKQTVRKAGCFTLCLILPQVPFMVRNSLYTGEWSGPSTAGPAVLALGNTPEAPPGGLDYPPTYHWWMNHQAERSVPGRMLDWAKEQPGAFLELQFRKFLLFWNAEDIPNNVSTDRNGRLSGFFPYAGFIPTGAILLLALAGLFLAVKHWRHDRKFQMLWLFLVFYALATAAFYILARFRVPAFGLLCIAAGVYPDRVWTTFRRRDWRTLVLYQGTALILGAAVCFVAYTAYRTGYEPGVMRQVRPSGTLLRAGPVLEIFDHGPHLMGGWSALPLKNDMEIVKRFVLPPGDGAEGKKARLKITFFAWEQLDFTLSVNGREERGGIGRHRNQEGWELFDIITQAGPCPADGVFRLRITGLPDEVKTSLLLDMQRDYGRTMDGADGKPYPAEAVIRLLLE